MSAVLRSWLGYIPTLPSEPNGNLAGSIQMKRVPCSFSFFLIACLPLCRRNRVGFKSTQMHVCVFISVNSVSFGCCLHDAMLAKDTGNLILQSSYLLQSCDVQPFKMCIICVCLCAHIEKMVSTTWQHPFNYLKHSKWQPKKIATQNTNLAFARNDVQCDREIENYTMHFCNQ